MSTVKCKECGKRVKHAHALRQHCDDTGHKKPGWLLGMEKRVAFAPAEQDGEDDAFEADWSCECEVCGAVPVVKATGMCGPCTFGEAETIGGNW